VLIGWIVKGAYDRAKKCVGDSESCGHASIDHHMYSTAHCTSCAKQLTTFTKSCYVSLFVGNSIAQQLHVKRACMDHSAAKSRGLWITFQRAFQTYQQCIFDALSALVHICCLGFFRATPRCKSIARSTAKRYMASMQTHIISTYTLHLTSIWPACRPTSFQHTRYISRHVS